MVVTVNVVLVAPAGITVDGGTWATDVRLLLKVIVAPPDGAGPLRVTIPVDELPPITVLGFRLTEVSPAGFTVRAAVRVTPL